MCSMETYPFVETEVVLSVEVHYQKCYAFFLNSGSIVSHAIRGKNTIGTVSPGNSSGNGVVSGRVMAMGMITQANEPTL